MTHILPRNTLRFVYFSMVPFVFPTWRTRCTHVSLKFPLTRKKQTTIYHRRNIPTPKSARRASRLHRSYVCVLAKPNLIVDGHEQHFRSFMFIFIYVLYLYSSRVKDGPTECWVHTPSRDAPRSYGQVDSITAAVTGDKNICTTSAIFFYFPYTRLFILKIFLYKLTVNKRFIYERISRATGAVSAVCTHGTPLVHTIIYTLNNKIYTHTNMHNNKNYIINKRYINDNSTLLTPILYYRRAYWYNPFCDDFCRVRHSVLWCVSRAMTNGNCSLLLWIFIFCLKIFFGFITRSLFLTFYWRYWTPTNN